MSKEKTKLYQQKFRKEWLKMPAFTKWLCEVPSDQSKAHCRYWRCNMLAKYSLLVSHCEAKKHKASTRQQMIPLKNKTPMLEANLAMFICCHSSFNGCDHFIELCKNYMSGSDIISKVKLHRTKCTNIVRNVPDIGDRKFSLLLDESNDISINKLLAVVIIYYSDTHK
ncbi:uncharacterized protein LOC106877131 [Octopus bimaculoides]|uniref:uncharacterized protein LOC106877131 n=1 Tax=Octopus bimaculoides TaxID=37653 RepID=UPI00071E1A1D|nr:uncharacterized protein LOC106877131 [Octopus bimaculoides]|eukprot:XP_014781419.1 PREDICTED: uncharacterized protein LOC106877131 [Octopus bimaculoides]